VLLTQIDQEKTLPVLLAGLVFLLFGISSLQGGYLRLFAAGLFLHLSMALSYDMVGGLLGYLHLGHGLFFGGGAYVAALALQHNLGIVAALVMGAVLMALAAVLLSLPLFRLGGAVFALATLGLLFLGYHLAANVVSLTGGTAGLSLPPSADTQKTFLAITALAALVVVGHWLVSTSSLGLKLSAVRESEEMAESIGINSGNIKKKALVLSAIPAAMAGCLHARLISFIVPSEVFSLEHSLAPVIMCLLIKPGTTWGPFLGAVVLTCVQELFWTTMPNFQSALYGLLLIGLGVAQTRRR